MSSSPDTSFDPFVDTTSEFAAVNSTNREALREEHAKSFEDYYIDDTIEREPYVEPPPKVKKTRGKKRAADVSDLPDTNAGPSKKTKISKKKASSSSAEGDITPEETQLRRSGRSNAGQKRKANEVTVDQPITPESPLIKKSKPPVANTTSKGKGKAVDMDQITPPKRPAGLTRTLRAEQKYPKTHTPSPQLEKTAESNPAEDSDVEPKAETPESSDVEERAVKSARTSTKQSPGQKQVKSAVPDGYKGTATSMGTTAERPPGAPLTQPWACANRACCSGMTWFHRESKGSDGFGRKTISQFFGRNKKETHRIEGDVWHTYCRKDYQRMYYKAVRAEGGEYKWHMDNLKQQFVRLKLWRPEATFTVALSKKMNEKSGEWHRILRKHNGDEVAAKAEFDKHKIFGVKDVKVSKRGRAPKTPSPEDAFPLDFFDEFQGRVCKSDVDYEGIKDVLDCLWDLYNDETLTQMPPIEFLISNVEEGETVRDPASNYQLWVDEMENETSSEEDAEAGVAQPKAEESDREDTTQLDERRDSRDIKAESSTSGNEGSEIHVAAAIDRENEPDFFGRLQEAKAQRAAAAAAAVEPNSDDEEDDEAASEADESNGEDNIAVSYPCQSGNVDHSTGTIVKSIEQSALAPLPLYTPPKPISKKPFKLTPTGKGEFKRLSTTLGSKPGNGRTPPANRPARN